MHRPVAKAWSGLILAPKSNIKVLVAGAWNWIGHTLAGACTNRGVTLAMAHIHWDTKLLL